MDGLKADIQAHVLSPAERVAVRNALTDVYFLLSESAGSAYWKHNDWVANALRSAADSVKELHEYIETLST